MKTIGVGLMIKNEEENLSSFLDQCIPFADRICIVDTGSTDKSKEIALEWASRYNIPLSFIEAKRMVSEEVDGDWLITDFGLARNIYLEHLDRLVDYVFTCSVGNVIHSPEKIRDVVKSNHIAYGFTIKRGTGTFIHHRLFKTKLGIKFYGAVHEYPAVHIKNKKPFNTGLVITHECGNQSSQESSAKRNLRILEREYKKDPSSHRTLFYYAMALRDCKRHKEAVKIYDEYLAGPDTFHDERMFAHYYKMCCLSTYHPNDAIKAGYKALADDQRFSEIPMLMAYMYFNAKKYDKALAMCLLAQQQPPESDMFLELCKYKQEPLDMINKIKNL